MNRRVAIAGIVLTGALTLVACLLIVAGLWFAFSAYRLATTNSSSSVNQNGSPSTGPSVIGLSVGAPAPDFTLTGLDQKTVQLEQLHGKVVLLNFWATWCGPCSAEMPNIEQVYQGLSRSEVAILAVNQGEFADQVRGYADLYHLHFPILMDDHEKVGSLYRVQALPTTVFIDRQGIIREIHIGGPMTVDFITTHIQSLLQQSP